MMGIVYGIDSLWGLTCVQTVTFFTQKSKDGPLLKASVRLAGLYPGPEGLKLLLGMFLDRLSLVSVLSDPVSTWLMGSKDVGYIRLVFEHTSDVLLLRLELPQSDGSSAEASCLVRFNYFGAVLYPYSFHRSVKVSNESKSV